MRALSLSSIAMLLAGCGPSVSHTTNATLVPGTGTYAWGAPLAGEGMPVAPTDANIRLRGRIQSAIDNALAAKGYRKVDESQAAFLARYSVGIKTETSEVRVAAPSNDPVPMTRCGADGCWSGWDYGYGSPNDPSFTEVTSRHAGVTLELVDRSSGAVAWQGRFEDEVTGRTPTDERLLKAMTTLTKSLPPAR